MAFGKDEILDANHCFVLSLPHVKVRRPMLIVEHADHNPKEPVDLWHIALTPSSRSA